MPAARRNTPIRLWLHPDLAAQFPPRAKRVGQTTSGLLAILVWNAVGGAVEPVRPPARLVRASVTCTLRLPMRRLAMREARRLKLKLNRYLEALVAEDLRAPLRPLALRVAAAEPGSRVGAGR